MTAANNNNAMITIFVQNSNKISQSIYDSVINNLQLHQVECSCGHSGCLSVHGYYCRNIKTSDANERLRIRRVQCSHCGRTHALLLSSFVPYSQIPLSIQHRIISDFENGSSPYCACDDCPDVDENDVKHVLRNYTKRFRAMLNCLAIKLSPITQLVKNCFQNYSTQFMQIHRGVNKLFTITT